MRFRDGLVSAPQLRTGEQVDRERHATWLELFYDLVFVAAIAQLATALSKQYDLEGLAKIAILFVPTWWAWVGQTFYLTRFDSDDVSHRLLTMAEMVFVASLAVWIPSAFAGKSTGFVISYVGIRVILIAQYLRAGKHLPQARPLTARYAKGFTLAASIWLASLLIPSPLRYFAWLLAICIDIGTPLSVTRLTSRIPPHVHHLPERFGLFIIIVLGESVIAVVQGIKPHGLHLDKLLVELGSLVIAFTVWWIYFDGVHGAEARRLSSANDILRFQIWLYSHLPLTFGIVVAAVGIKHALALPPLEPLHGVEGVMLAAGVTVCMLCMHLLFLNSPNIECTDRLKRYARPHWAVTAAIGLCIFFAPHLPSGALVGALALGGIAHTILSLRPYSEPEPVCDPVPELALE